MMEDTGEDILRAKPSPVGTFFKRVGQVRFIESPRAVTLKMLNRLTEPLFLAASRCIYVKYMAL